MSLIFNICKENLLISWFNTKKFKKYYIINDTVIFFNNFDEELEDFFDIILQYQKISFSEYKLPCFSDTNYHYEYYNHKNYKEYGKFNRTVDYLPYKLTHLKLSHNFNKTVYNLPCNLTHLL